MYTFTFYYNDGNSYSAEHIVKVQYTSNGIKTITEDEILTYYFTPEHTYHLFSESGNYYFHNKKLRHIAVEKEN